MALLWQLKLLSNFETYKRAFHETVGSEAKTKATKAEKFFAKFFSEMFSSTSDGKLIF